LNIAAGLGIGFAMPDPDPIPAYPKSGGPFVWRRVSAMETQTLYCWPTGLGFILCLSYVGYRVDGTDMRQTGLSDTHERHRNISVMHFPSD